MTGRPAGGQSRASRSREQRLLCVPCGKTAVGQTADNRLRCGDDCPEPIAPPWLADVDAVDETEDICDRGTAGAAMIGPYCAACGAWLHGESHHDGCPAATASVQRR